MTVTYTAEVATVKGFGCFLRLLFRWKGSIYKLVWPDLVLFLVLYYALNIMYRFFLDEDQKRIFEIIAEYCETQSNFIPLSFVLGFYVSIVMTRWWDQYNNIPWPDPIAVYVSAHVHGQDERGRLMRRTVMRYCCLCLTMVFTMISPRVKKRFPTVNHFVEAGLLLENEKLIICDLDEKFPRHAKHWLPIVWAASIITRARKEGRIRDDFAVKTIIDELNKFRGMCGQLLNYDSISVPLVYTQVVTLAVYTFFATCVMGRQWIDKTASPGTPSRYKIDLYFPIFTLLQFFFYMGWLKVAESLINPFGEDDDDFEVNWLVDRNLQVSYLIVDEMHHEHPELIKDQYWDEVFPTELPYTIASEPFREKHPQPSTANIEIPKSAAEISSLKVDELGDQMSYQYEDNISGIHFFAGGKRNSSRISQRDRALSGSSSSSTVNLGSMAHSINRVGSIASMLKNIFTRENSTATVPEKVGSQTINLGPNAGSGRIHSSQSAASLPKSLGAGGTLRITDQVIEEVDEQMTLTSMKRQSPDRMNVRDIFTNSGRPPQSNPVDVPLNNMNRSFNLSVSAPSETATNLSEFAIPPFEGSIQSAPVFESPTAVPKKAEMDDMSLGSAVEIEEEVDEFTRLKAKRSDERKRKFARSVSQRQDDGDADRDTLLSTAGSEASFT
ncbi:UNVERIFIED_CONTAM: hypothetical protein PYX00_008258 [Menopon gallinae]|uniref:Bestrophin homolog n=1 Tax=Menopon gallinae TaxID=328185 RepID=A0AAW2HNA5_9NEOP